ncbi:MAG: HlyD family efflux transporter periplasmic adaptor subunit, partial [Clostridia bacterium]|nr:HlyD family efflux transporter periplasmic adaptor subunit [Clostridia bacterium]
SVETVAGRYGTVLYIAPENKYSITADIEKAYNSSETRYVNIGEEVFLSCTTDGSHTATGVITGVNGTSYTVETTSGELVMGETVNVYRSDKVVTKQRVGRGTVSRTAEISVSGSGSILYMHVKDGDTVERGQLLFETVTGSLDGLYATSNKIVSEVSGIIASVDVKAGANVQKGATLLTVYPQETLQIEIDITEYDLSSIKEGDSVSISFNWDETAQTVYEGTVSMISHVSSSQETEASYKGYVDFVPGENVRLGMTVVVYTRETTIE